MNKRITNLVAIALFLLLSNCIFAQTITTTSYKPNPFEVQKKKSQENKSAQCLRLDSISSSFYSIKFEYSLNSDNGLVSTKEVYTDFDMPQYSFKSEFEYDSNFNLTKNKMYSWKNNQWKFSSYEEFEYDNLGRKTLRTNANDLFDTGFEIGGKGYFTYDANGRLVEYLQDIHKGNNEFEHLTKTIYLYPNPLEVEEIYYQWQEGNWIESIKNKFIHISELGENKLITNMFSYMYNEVTSTFENDAKYEWQRNAKGRVIERNKYNNLGTSAWSSTIIDQYIFTYDTISDKYPCYPSITNFRNDWEQWFKPKVNGHSNIIDKHNWSTQNLQTGLLAFIETSTYHYNSISIGLNHIRKDKEKLSILPNPAKDYLTINYQAKGRGKSYRVINLFGAIVLEGKLGNPSERISLQGLTSGIYVIEVSSHSGEISRERFIISK